MPSLFAAVVAASLTIHDYATMPTMSSPRLSPDGTCVAYVVTRADLTRSTYDSDIWLIASAGGEPIQLTRGRGSDGSPRWSPDGKTLAFVSDRDGRAALWLLSMRGGEPRRLGDLPGSVRDPSWSPDGRSIAFLMTDAPPPDEERRAREHDDVRVIGEAVRQTHLYVADVATGSVRRLTRGGFSVNAASWSPDGGRLALERMSASGLDGLYRTDLYSIESSAACDDDSCPNMTPLVVRPGLDRSPQYSPDGKSLAFVSTGGVADWLREHDLSVLDLATGRISVVSGGYARTPEGFSWLDSKALFFDGPLNSTSQLFRVNADGSGFRALSDVAGVIADHDLDGASKSVVFVLQTPTAPPEVFISPATSYAPRQLTRHNEALRGIALAETRLVRWKNPKDGREIEGLLTLPPGRRQGQRVPLLTFVHGGPASRFDQSFLGYLGHLYAPQVLAWKGFAVLRPNPRGTGGYGQGFREANRNDWGGMDWIDINSGIDALIADGTADPDRLGVMGWSYGGFIASWAAARSERFKAISIGAPVVDLMSHHGTSDIHDFIPSYFPAPAPPATAADGRVLLPLDLLRERSPLWHLAPTKAHILIQHGEADDRVPLSQGTMLYRRLVELGADVTMVTYPRSPHTPREPKQRIDVMTRNVEFFEKWLM